MQQPASLSDFHEHLQMRVPAVQEAIKRTRFAFFLCTLAALASIICLWNAYASTYRSVVATPLPYACQAAPGQCADRDEKDRERELLLDAFKSWVDSQSININLLGIRIGVSDFAVMDSLAMYIFVYYSLLTIRRENREVGQILRDISRNLDLVGYAAYCAINSYMVFNLNRTDDNPIDSLKESNQSKVKIALIRGVGDLLLWAPFFVIVLTVFCDAMSLYITKAPSQFPFFVSLYRDGGIVQKSISLQMVFYFLMDGVAVFLAILTAIAIKKTQVYGRATRTVLEDFSSLLHEAQLLPESVSEA